MLYHYLLLFTPVMMGVVLTILIYRMNKEEENKINKRQKASNNRA